MTYIYIYICGTNFKDMIIKIGKVVTNPNINMSHFQVKLLEKELSSVINKSYKAFLVKGQIKISYNLRPKAIQTYISSCIKILSCAFQ